MGRDSATGEVIRVVRKGAELAGPPGRRRSPGRRRLGGLVAGWVRALTAGRQIDRGSCIDRIGKQEALRAHGFARRNRVGCRSGSPVKEDGAAREAR